jgi:flagellar hook-basal body complex protein FliE
VPISPIGSIAAPSLAALNPVTSTGATGAAEAAGTNGNPAAAFTDSLNAASGAQGQADDLMGKAATGQLTDLTSVMSAMTEAQLSTQLTVALRNKAVESFNEIMRMQI